MSRIPESGFYTDAELKLPQGPVQDVTSVDYTAGQARTGVTEVISDYQQDSNASVIQDVTNEKDYGGAFSAGLQQSLIGNALRWMSDESFPEEQDFRLNTSVLPGAQFQPPTGEELEVLSNAKSNAEALQLWGNIQEDRYLAQKAADAPMAALAGALAGDLPLALASFGAGAGVAAAGAGARIGAAVEVGLGAAEAGAAYALGKRSTSLSGVDVVAPMLGGIAGGLIGLKVYSKGGKETLASSDAGIYTQQASPVQGMQAKAPVDVEVRAGEQFSAKVTSEDLRKHVSVTNAPDSVTGALVRDLDVPEGLTINVKADPNVQAQYNASTNTITVGAGKAGDIASDAVSLLARMTPKQVQSLRHEIFHASTIKNLEKSVPLVKEGLDELRNLLRVQIPVKYSKYLSNSAEMLAGLADPAFAKLVANANIPTEVLAKVSKGNGAKGTTEALASMFKQSVEAKSVPMEPKFYSQTFNDVMQDTTDATLMQDKLAKAIHKATGSSEATNVIVKHLSLYDRIRNTGKETEASVELADALTSDGAAVGARTDSVADNVRLMQVKAAPFLQGIELATVQALKQAEVSRWDIFRNSSKYRAAREVLGEEVSTFMHRQYMYVQQGLEAEPIPARLAAPIEALQKYYKFWADEVADLPELAEAIKANPWYLPRTYDYTTLKAMMDGNSLSTEDVLQMLTDAFKTIKREGKAIYTDAAARTKAKEMYEGIVANGTGERTFQWKEVLDSSIDGKSFESGPVRRDWEIGKDLEIPGAKRAARNAAGNRAMKRAEFDVNAPLLEKGGTTFTLNSFAQSDFFSTATRYGNSLAGRTSLARAGLSNPEDLEKLIAAAAKDIPAKEVKAWRGAVDDAMNQITGVVEQTPQLARIASNLAVATFLKNSGLYQLIDMATALAERGIPAYVRAMSKQGTLDALQTLSKEEAQEFLDLMHGSVITKDATFKWLHDQTLRAAEYTKVDAFETISSNMAQSMMKANLLHSVARAQAAVHSRIIIATADKALKGDAAALKALNETAGLSTEEIQAWAKSRSEGSFIQDSALRRKVENGLLRMQDNYTQQHRIGEIPAWATATSLGRVLVGFAKFALAGTNKIMRRTANRGMGPFVLLALYQVPMTYAVQYAKAQAEGKEKEPKDLLIDTAMSMSMLGSFPMYLDPFMQGNSRVSNPGISWLTQAPMNLIGMSSGNPNDIYKGGTMILGPAGALPIRAVTQMSGVLDSED